MRMDEIMRLTSLDQSSAVGSKVRLVHHVTVGLNGDASRQGIVAVSSLLTVVHGETLPGGPTPPPKLLVRSRRATGMESVGGFQMLPA